MFYGAPFQLLAAYIGMLIIAAASGGGLAYWLAGPSRICMVLGAVGLACGYVASLMSLYWGHYTDLMNAILPGIPGERPDVSPLESTESPGLHRSVLCVPICVFMAAGFGFTIAYLSRALFVSSFFSFALAGAGYGWLLHQLVIHRILIDPEEME